MQPIFQIVHLIRHAKAVERDEWTGEDRLRPLTEPGLRQAEAFAKQYTSLGISWIRSSPAIRCVQTVEPLAKACGLIVVQDVTLYEGVRLVLPREAGEHVICAHGDNIPWLLDEFGLEWDHCRKGSVWTLRLDAAGKLLHPTYAEM